MRRSIVEELGRVPSPVGRLADKLPVSRSAVSQHLKILKDAGIVTEHAEGTRRIYRLDPRGLGALRDWLDQHWAQALDAFAKFAENEVDALEEEVGK